MSVRSIEAEVSIKSGVQAECTIGREVIVEVHEEVNLESLTVTANGQYEPSEGIDGYDKVTVSVPPTIPDISPLTVTEDGTYQASGDGYNPVVVNTGVGALRQEIASAKTASGCDPLVAGINGLTVYANDVTGAEDSTLSDAVETLASKWQNPEGSLPDAYQQVEYIDGSASGAVIDTGVQPNQDTWAEIKVTPLAITGDALFGTKGNSDNLDWRFFNHNSTLYFDYKNIRSSAGSFTVNTTKTVYLRPMEKLDPYSVPYDVFINGASRTLTAKAQWYYVKIYEGDTMLRSFVPCYRKTDNVVGMYDLVNGVFYTSVGSGAFTAGADI